MQTCGSGWSVPTKVPPCRCGRDLGVVQSGLSASSVLVAPSRWEVLCSGSESVVVSEVCEVMVRALWGVPWTVGLVAATTVWHWCVCTMFVLPLLAGRIFPGTMCPPSLIPCSYTLSLIDRSFIQLFTHVDTALVLWCLHRSWRLGCARALMHTRTHTHTDPGVVRVESREVEGGADTVERCPTCDALMLPRSAHCLSCKRCVMRYDHHCDWVGNCALSSPLSLMNASTLPSLSRHGTRHTQGDHSVVCLRSVRAASLLFSVCSPVVPP